MAKALWKNNETCKELLSRLTDLQIKDSQPKTCNWIKGHKNYNSKFEGNGFVLYELLLKEQVKFHEDIPENCRSMFVGNAIFQAADDSKLTLGYVTELIRKQQKEYLAKPNISYTLITKISLAGVKSKINVKTPNSAIIISKYLPKKFKPHYDFKFIEKNTSNLNLASYAWTTVTIEARCQYSAATKALNELGFYLGSINLLYNYSQDRSSFGTRFEPVNKLRRFKYHMLHFTTGERASDLYWYEPNFADYGKVLHYVDNEVQNAHRGFRKLLSDINTLKRYGFFKTVFNRYVEALEATDMNRSFRSLWSLLETLTFTGKDNYDVTIHRTVALFRDKFVLKNQLEMLRERRNMAVHSDTQFADAERMTYMLMRIVNAYVYCMLDVMEVAKTDDQIRAVLDLPFDLSKLESIDTKARATIDNVLIFKKLVDL